MAGPEAFFLDAEVQSAWAEFLDAARAFVNTLVQESFGASKPGWRTVDPGDDVEEPRRRHLLNERRSKLNDVASATWRAYGELARVARTRVLV